MKRFFALAATLALSAAALTPLASQAHSPSYGTVHYTHGAPSHRYDHPPHARRGHVWQRGHWEHRGHRKVWVEGHWVRVRPGYGHHGAMAHGYGRGYGRDLDRDGIPDAHDRDRDNDGVPNWHDRDRDGDGVRNEYDRRPDNRYR